MQVANTLPDVNTRRDPRGARRRHARLPADPAERRAARRSTTRSREPTSGTRRPPRRTCARRSSASSRPRATARKITRLLAERRRNLRHVIHNFQELSTALARPGQAARAPRGLGERELPGVRVRRSRPCARRCGCSPARSSRPARRSRRRARWPRSSVPRSSGCGRSRASWRPRSGRPQPVLPRDDADHPRPDPAVRPRRAADGARPPLRDERPGRRSRRGWRARSACSTASSTCWPTTRPARGARSTSGPPGRPTPAPRCSTSRTRRGRSAGASCSSTATTTTSSSRSSSATRSSELLATLLNLPPEQQACPQNQPPDDFVP